MRDPLADHPATGDRSSGIRRAVPCASSSRHAAAALQLRRRFSRRQTKGSSRITGERGANLEEEVFVVAVPVSS
ncbi:hypothetical protein, partial [Burkholderia multivorans]|uniref:hypothetical protein n=1 Tax=Burkholderia multivorans TaxID=87883 RepID=UPI00286FE865